MLNEAAGQEEIQIKEQQPSHVERLYYMQLNRTAASLPGRNPSSVGLQAARSAQTFWFLQRREKSLLLSGI
jgi:hypothetical protein